MDFMTLSRVGGKCTSDNVCCQIPPFFTRTDTIFLGFVYMEQQWVSLIIIHNQPQSLPMRKYQFYLSILKIREQKLHLSTANYYLCVQNAQQEKEVTSCRNIILHEGIFIFEVRREIKSVEIWNYDQQRKVATIFLKREKPTCFFAYQFKNFNLKLTINSFNLILEEDLPDLSKNSSMRTVESQSDLNDSEQSRE